MIDIGTKIRAAREERGLSRRAFGDLAGISEAKVQAIEIGKQRVDHDTLHRIVTTMNIDVTWLLYLGQPTISKAAPLEHIEIDHDRLRLAIEAIEEGLDAVGRTASPDIKAKMISAAYELFEQEGAKATAQIIRLVKTA